MFDARRNAYEGMLDLLQHRRSTVKAFRLEAAMDEGSKPEPFTESELQALRARLRLYAPDHVRASADDFLRELNRLALAVGRLERVRDGASMYSEEASKAGIQLPDETSRRLAGTLSKRETEVAEADRKVGDRFEALSRAMQGHLEGRSSSDDAS